MSDGLISALPDPLEMRFIQEWQAAQLGQQHVAKAITDIIESWKTGLVEIDRLRAENSALMARVAELVPAE